MKTPQKKRIPADRPKSTHFTIVKRRDSQIKVYGQASRNWSLDKKK